MSEIEKLIQAMHDSLCRCGGWCEGAADDLFEFVTWVKSRWGYYYPLEDYLIRMRNASENHDRP